MEICLSFSIHFFFPIRLHVAHRDAVPFTTRNTTMAMSQNTHRHLLQQCAYDKGRSCNTDWNKYIPQQSFDLKVSFILKTEKYTIKVTNKKL